MRSRRCPDWLELQRQKGLFAVAHVGMNLNYLFLKLPAFTNTFPYLKPDGLGMSVLLTSPGLLLALLAPWRDRRSWLLLLAAVLVLIPTLLYYGGGWLQFGYRYFLDSIPFVWALGAMGGREAGPGAVVGLDAHRLERAHGARGGVLGVQPALSRVAARAVVRGRLAAAHRPARLTSRGSTADA